MTAADLPTAHRIECQSPSPWSHKQLAEELTFPGALQLACRSASGNALVGFLLGRLFHGEAEILKIAAAREFQRQRIASSLLQSFLSLAGQRGVNRFYLELRAQNAPALALYEKHDFEMTGRRRNYYTAPKDDALCMTLAFPPELMPKSMPAPDLHQPSHPTTCNLETSL